MFRQFFFLLVISSLYCCSDTNILSQKEKEWIEQQDSIKVALFPYYPPYQFIDENNEIEGVFIEYLNLIEKKIDYRFQKKKYNIWDNVMEDIKTQKIDIVLEIQKTETRSKYLEFQPELFEAKYYIITPKDSLLGNNLSSFKDKTIAVPRGYAVHDILSEQYPNINIALYEDDKECIKAINDNKHDAYITSKMMFNYLVRMENLQNVKIGAEINQSYKPSIAISKNNSILNEIMTKAVNSISIREKDKLLHNWLYKPVTPYYLKIRFWIYLSSGVMCILIFIVGFNRYLKFKIKQQTNELRKAKDKAEESSRLKTNFIRNISHEIRTPMNGIVGFSSLLKDTDITHQDKDEFTENILISSERLLKIIDNIMEISMLETNLIKTYQKEIELDKLFTSLYKLHYPKALSKSISLEITNKIPNEYNNLVIDELKLMNVLDNLVDNAIKFTNTGSVKILSELKDGNITVSIKDTGIGINLKNQKVIFDSFYQTEKELAESFGGLGLGLAIAKKNIELMGGSIVLTSRESEGSTFIISIPYHFKK
ncbi:transporter substrate-binding domain-containing protein [uncultured Aquimarina sp.]|uniref:ATP-binding protein n=1 Tax=uncultured Aquimarina sp. TaxID=575652 RepID=UPI002634F3A6|nr:transporter substrate-binding domain-containing protein [uncultured Aquimarina sp.]